MNDGAWFVGTSVPMCELRENLDLAIHVNSSVLITGERGVGKNAAARLIHDRSLRGSSSMMTIGCADLPEDRDFADVMQMLTEGSSTVMFDEIGDMSPSQQAGLMRFLDTRSLPEVDDTGEAFRLMASTSRDMRERIQQGRFVEDLFYRLNVIHLVIPPLRNHREDIPALIHHLVRVHAHASGVTPPRLSSDSLDKIVRYSWPGNVQELDAVAATIARLRQDIVRPEHLHEQVQTAALSVVM